VTHFVDGMAERDIPLHVFHFDCFWMKEFHWCNFEWDARVFPDPEGMLHRLKEKGLKICVWINPYIAQRSALFDEGMQNGYLLKRPDGCGREASVWQWDRWQAGMGTDASSASIPPSPTPAAGTPPNCGPHGTWGDGRAAVPRALGRRQRPTRNVGPRSVWASMAESLRGGLSLCTSGFGFWSHDIGGFEQTASAIPTERGAVYKRWCAFGLLSSHSRLHGASAYRVPWLFDEAGSSGPTASDVLRFFTKLKCRLMPYLYAAAVVAHETGVPVMRAMPLEYPDDPACDTLKRQYMLGERLLVVPVFSPDGMVDYYLPAGRWTNFLNGEVVEGGR
jgi:alpha-D-xyloside xylohydrolase